MARIRSKIFSQSRAIQTIQTRTKGVYKTIEMNEVQTVVISKNLTKGALGTTTPIVWVWPSYSHAHIFKDGSMIM